MKYTFYCWCNTQKRPEQRTRETYAQEVADFRALWAKEDISNYYVLDESGIWEDTVIARSYAPMGANGTSVATVGHASRDTVIATLCG